MISLRPSSRTLLQLLAVTLIISPSFIAANAAGTNRAAILDFDGDGKTDYVVVRNEIPHPSGFKLVWYIKGSQDGARAQQWGLNGMSIIPADYDGDGKWDIAVWTVTQSNNHQAYFHIWRSSDNTYQRIAWGTLYDDPYQTQDFDGDGKADPTVTRSDPETGALYWYSLLTTTGEARVTHFGSGERALRGDFDGDGKADLALHRTQIGTASTFIIQRSSDNQIEFYSFGVDDHYAALGDYDGDGKTDIGMTLSVDDKIWWYWRESSTGIVRARQFGISYYDARVQGDYDGDGITDFAVWRVYGESFFFVDGSKDGFSATHWGIYWNYDQAVAATLQVH